MCVLYEAVFPPVRRLGRCWRRAGLESVAGPAWRPACPASFAPFAQRRSLQAPLRVLDWPPPRAHAAFTRGWDMTLVMLAVTPLLALMGEPRALAHCARVRQLAYYVGLGSAPALHCMYRSHKCQQPASKRGRACEAPRCCRRNYSCCRLPHFGDDDPLHRHNKQGLCGCAVACLECVSMLPTLCDQPAGSPSLSPSLSLPLSLSISLSPSLPLACPGKGGRRPQPAPAGLHARTALPAVIVAGYAAPFLRLPMHARRCWRRLPGTRPADRLQRPTA